jgi:ABC-type multidrug transport system fused ATPase/permease subunit
VVVELRDVTFLHENSTLPSLDSASLVIREGDRVAIVGRMGSGKTTLVRLMLRLLDPTSGSVLLRGRPYTELSLDRLRGEFGYVPQGAALFDRTVLENALYGVPGGGDRAEREEAVWSAARAIGLDGVFASMPDGLATPAGKGGSRLSGGQRQAVWLVRMQLLRPSVLVLDEPTSAMDPATRSAVSAAVARFRTVVFVTHDREFADAVATRRVTLDSGHITGDDDLMSSSHPPPGSTQNYDVPQSSDHRRRLIEEGLVGAVRYHQVA